MLCAGECEFQKTEDRRKGFLARILQKYTGFGGSDVLKETTGGSAGVSRSGEAMLGKGELYIVNMAGRCKICCTKGAAWVTCTGFPGDYILNEGESLLLEGEGKIVISGGSMNSLIRICNG